MLVNEVQIHYGVNLLLVPLLSQTSCCKMIYQQPRCPIISFIYQLLEL